MANTGELPPNVVIWSKPKLLVFSGLNQKVGGAGELRSIWSHAEDTPHRRTGRA